jgi:hypothetical protein
VLAWSGMFLNCLELLMSLLPNLMAASLSAGRKIFWGGSTHFCWAIIHLTIFLEESLSYVTKDWDPFSCHQTECHHHSDATASASIWCSLRLWIESA